MIKWIIGIVVVVAAGAALWWSGWLPGSPTQTATSTPQLAQETQEVPQNGMSASNNSSDAAIAQDTAAVDAQLTALTQDSASVDSSLSDKPVQQSY